MSDPDLDLAQNLIIPPEFNNKRQRDDESVQWNEKTQSLLKSFEGKQLSNSRSIASIAQLIGPEVWLEQETNDIAQRLLDSTEFSIELIRSILEDYVKPIFLANPHPQVNLNTGRILPKLAGGSLASIDYYQEQNWKGQPGVANVVSWCIRHIPENGYEQVWHLLIPPLMILIDDYQAAYKLRGALLALDLLENVPVTILKRTGISKLLLTALSKAYTSLHDDLSPDLIRTITPIILRLIDKTTEPNSEQRFDQIFHILGDHIIGSVWVFSNQEKDTIEASMEVLPSLIHNLGIGTVRYLKALIPQCVHCITLNENVPRTPALEKASLKALVALIQECEPRMDRWKDRKEREMRANGESWWLKYSPHYPKLARVFLMMNTH
ncbi:atp :trna-specific trna nucleotidyltransferase [Pyrrhoderma noxium]|uniref:Atp:trna-specific trna nucleotidyltransferase n=1 Tax=Pyrrhoderma noxium TaxID=2282107 RepID=A0A286UMH3_9AGAM|nr:atp :trna-specific trna nucleotidyltransferase [Pyrrhoderma noxium]